MTTLTDFTASEFFDVPEVNLTPHPRLIGQFESAQVLVFNGRRFGIGYVSEHGTARRVHGGPELPGPHPLVWEKTTVIALMPEPRGMEIHVQVGDVISFQGHLFTVAAPTPNDRRKPQLIPAAA